VIANCICFEKIFQESERIFNFSRRISFYVPFSIMSSASDCVLFHFLKTGIFMN